MVTSQTRFCRATMGTPKSLFLKRILRRPLRVTIQLYYLIPSLSVSPYVHTHTHTHTPRSVGFCLHSANSFWRLESDWKVERGSQGCLSFFFLHSVSGSRVCPCQQVPWIQPLVGAPPAWAPLKPPGEGAGSFVPTLVSGSLYCPIFGFHLLYNQFPAFSSLWAKYLVLSDFLVEF